MSRTPSDPASGVPVPGYKPPAPAKAAGKAAGRAVSASGDAAEVVAAIGSVSGLSGSSFSTLLAQATQESGLDTKARNRKSTAAGPFQFLERTWFDMVRRHGAEYGLDDLASQISVKHGTPTVQDPTARKKILALRDDPKISAGMAARLLSEGKDALTRKLGRPASDAESRIAYVMGAGGAARLIKAAEKSPNTLASALLPDAARANRSIFHGEHGRALTAHEVVAKLTNRMQADDRRVAALVPSRAQHAPAAAVPKTGAPTKPAADPVPTGLSALMLAQELG
jgi:hypothetical protein